MDKTEQVKNVYMYLFDDLFFTERLCVSLTEC